MLARTPCSCDGTAVPVRLLVVALVLGGCGAPATVPVDPSNVTRADYVGPDVCGECHADEHARWSESLHRTMNQRAEDPGAVIGDFAHASLVYQGRTVRFEPGPVMDLAGTRYAITRTIGTRGLQEYVGIADGSELEVRLPFGWWPRRGGWSAQPMFDPWLDERAFDAFAPAVATDPWAARCPWCHSTYPFAQRAARSTTHDLGHGLERHFTSTAPGSEHLAVAEQVTTGISCESCHLGGRAHASGAAIHLVPQGDAIAALPGAPRATTFAQERRDPDIVNATCAQCHSGPSPRLPDGSALRNSSEALDLARSKCVGIRCVDCHDPHRADARDDEARAIASCTSCHPTFVGAAHAKHADATASCLDCHMPAYVLGIDRFVRSHQIASPRVIAEDRPNACTLCHLERSRDWTLAARGFRGEPDGDLRGLGERWLASPSAAIRLIAIAAYGRLGDPAHRARILQGLVDPAAYVRAFSAFALDDLDAR